MTAGPWQFPNGARQNLLNGTFDIDSDSWKVALVQSTSNIGPSTTTWAGVTNEVANGNGYATGGQPVTLALAGTASVTASFASDPVFTAAGGSISGIRTAVLYEVGGNVLAYCLVDSTPADVTVTSGNTLTIDSDGTPGPVFTLA
jgi:hypothetical protein